ncbi:MAG: polysaccharide biosynthesis tyrosine autokinase [Porphyromonadaceae bacterium]|nr:polysaccharide biosynthesis tyrosine autokinase [Porphyromonadaceae bacterium]
MENTNNIPNIQTFSEEEASSFNLMEWVMRFLKYWYLFAIGVVIALTIAYYQNRSFVPIYNSSLRLLLKQESGSFLSMQNFNSGFSRQDQTNIENQILLLQSQDLIGRTIDSLPNFKIDFYRKLKFKNRPMYGRSPIDIEIISTPDAGFWQYYLYQKQNDNEFTIKIFDNEDVELETVKGRYNEPVGCKYFLIKVTKNSNYHSANSVNFVFRNRDNLVMEFASKLQINLLPNTSVLNISVASDNPIRDVDFLSKHAKSFLDDNLDKKNYEADKTIQFINDQLSVISDSLSRSESNLNSFKIANKMYGQNNSILLTNKMEALEEQGKIIKLRDEYFKYLRNYLKNNIDSESLASPTTIGIQEPRLIALVDKYNELQIKLLDLGVKNPQYDIVFNQISQTKAQLNELISSVSDIYKIESDAYQKDLNELNNLLIAAPNKELRMLDYERRYKINDSYYTFLLQKRSEAQIRKASNSPDNAVMQKARTMSLINAKEKQNKYIVFLLIGLAVPAALIILKELLNNAIRTEKDIEKAIKNKFQIIGTVRHTKHKADEKVIAAKYPNSYFVEQLRVIRTKIELILKRKERITMLVSSTESGDGKTYISLNLAGVFALQKKKVLLIDFDIRKPNLTRNLGDIIKTKSGFVNYMIGDCTIEEAIESTPYGFDFLKAGVIPPNPGEFVRRPQLLEMINLLKEMYDYVVIDSSPLGLVADAYALFSTVDIKLLIVRSLKTNKVEFTDLAKRLYADNVEDIYVILNDVDKSKVGYGYGYSKYKNMGNYYVTEEFEQDDISMLEKIIDKIGEKTKRIRNIHSSRLFK